ncbi:MAG: aromatic ring-hydroxylating dioxygenase subunit alpha [Actinomycetota bacterium]|nr:aromatic ring-hydroxylating dioxygenase subunit alpha [Actinomycetota bacterium]
MSIINPLSARAETPDELVDRVVDEVAESVLDVASARTMPPEAYTSEAFAAFEREAVFMRSWLYLCHASEIAEPGDRLSVTVADEPLIVTRDLEGTIHVLSAVCQHRGFVIPDDDGEGRHLRCPYHYWTYGLDGRLVGAPSMTPAHDLDHLKATISLPRLRVEVWHGLVFANFDPDAEPLAPTLAKLDPEVAPYGFEDLVVVDSRTFADLPFNWKNMQENALEQYHTTYVHRGWHENAPAHLVTHPTFEEGEGGVFRHAGLVQRAGEPIEGFPPFPVMEGLPDELYERILFFAVPPLNFGAVEAMGIKMFRIVPQAAGLTTLTITWLYPRSTIARDDFDELMAGQLALIEAIDQPDLESNIGMYRGLRSRFAPRGPYSPYEATLPQFNAWLLERYRAEQARRR